MMFEDLIEKGFLRRIKSDKDMIEKELKEAEYDLKMAKNSFNAGDFKWSTIKAYYSIFHASRAFLFSKGLKEKRHFVIGIILEKFAQNSEISFKLVNDFHAAITAREDADYRSVYSKETAKYIIDIAEEFLEEIKKLKV